MFVVRKEFLVLGNRTSAWVPYEGINGVKAQRCCLCKTPIVFDDEYSAMNIPNRATANETRSQNYNGTPFSLGISLSHREAKASTA